MFAYAIKGADQPSVFSTTYCSVSNNNSNTPTACLYKQQSCRSVFSSPVQSTGRAIVLTLASAFALVLVLAFPSRHF